MTDIQREAADLVGKAMAMSARMEKAWCIICTDDESGHVVCVYGAFDSPESALIVAGETAREDRKENPNEKYLWSYKVVPYANKEEA